jgi:hypothetical protein
VHRTALLLAAGALLLPFFVGIVTFAPSGDATRATVEEGPLRGTPAGSCVALRLRRIHLAPFDGRLATVRTTLVLR